MVLRASSEGSHWPRCWNCQMLRLAICERQKVSFVMKGQILVLQSIKVFCALWSSLFSPFNFPKMSAK